MKRRDDGYEQMMRIEDPYYTAPDADLEAYRLAEAEFGAVGTGNLGDVTRRRDLPLDAPADAPAEPGDD
jgi:hypothetical protein